MYKILTVEDKPIWWSFLKKMENAQQDIYYTPEYHELYQKKGEGIAKCFVIEQDGNIGLYPFLINSVNALGYKLDKEYYDIQGVYGLNGPLLNTINPEFIKLFAQQFKSYCEENNIIAEFTRFNPLLENHNLLEHLQVISIGKVVNVDLKVDYDAIWSKGYSRDVRRIIKKGNEAGYEVFTKLLEEASEEEIDSFFEVYYSTLKRNSADSYYYYDKEYLLSMQKRLGKNVIFSYVRFDNKVISVSINPFMNVNSYGFLGGSLKEYQKISPFTYMLDDVIKNLKSRGVENYFLGGGTERILKYKQSYNKFGEKDFYIGTNIHNHGVYETVINQWVQKAGDSNNMKILRYR